MLSNMFAIKTWTFVVLFACLVYGQRKPPNYQQNEMPPTSFSCKDKIVGGYYADPETSCQMFHVCVNVVGTGVQDFRFLCPNDTAFDQENQICDDWYNIDCEAATLYYSDNFDLYKLGSGGAPAAASAKVTPIPLGPSSASPNAQQPAKSRKPSLSAPVNNAVSEQDDDYYLQRSDSSDSRLQHDLLRGSSSGNFFSNRNRGIENPDDYDDTAGRVAHSSSKDVPKKNAVAQKTPFRKLLTGKKPLSDQTTPTTTTGAWSTTTAASTTTGFSTTAAAATTVRQPNYKPTTYRSKDRGRVNYKTYLDKQTKPDEYDFQKAPKPAAQPTTFAPAAVSGNGVSYQPTTVRAAQAANVQPFVQANQPRNNDFLRLTPNNNNNNNNGFQSARVNAASNNNNNNFQANNNNNNFQANNNNNNNNFQANNNNNNNFQSNKVFPANNNNNNNNNFQANNGFQANNNNNNFQANNAFLANNNFPANNAFSANNNNNFQGNNANKNFQQNYNQGLQADKVFPPAAQNNFNQASFQSEKIHPASTTTQKYVQNPTTNVYQTNSFQQQQQQQVGGNAFQQSSTFQPSNTFQQANTFQPANNNAYTPQQGGNQFQAAVSTTQKYNTYQPYQQSTNVFQSSTPFNAGNSFQQQQQQQQQTSQQPQQFQSTTEHFSKDFKAKFDPYSSYHQRTNEEAGETLKTASSTNLRPSDLNALIHGKPKSINATLSVGYSFNKADGGVAKSTVVVPAPTTQKPRPFSTQPAVTVTTTTPVAAAATSSRAAVTSTTGFAAGSTKKTVVKDKDSTYDYAYYDDSNHNDYTDVVPEDFSRIHNAKN